MDGPQINSLLQHNQAKICTQPCNFVPVARLSNLKNGEINRVRVANKDIALVRVDKEVFAVNNMCPHQDASLADGDVEDRSIICPVHGWAFDLASGRRVDVEGDDTQLQHYPLKLDGNNVLVAVDSEVKITTFGAIKK